MADKTPRSAAPKTPLTPTQPEERYEALIEQLEELVERIESGQIGLEQSIEAYEKGVGLVARARAILARAEQRIETLDLEALRKPGPTEESS